MTVGRPPRLARWLLGLLVPRDQLRDAEGDLAERFGQRCMSGGRSAAVRWYWWQVVRVVPLAGRRFWESTAERCRAWLTGGWSGDVRAVCRTAWRRPGYPLAVVLTLGLGLGAAAVILTVADGVWFRPLPFPDSDRVVRVYEVDRNPVPASVAGDVSLRPGATHEPRSRLSPPLVEDLRAADWQTLSGVAGVSRLSYDWVDGGHAERVTASVVSPEFTAVLGIQPLVGRAFSLDLPHEVLLGHGFWQRAFGGDDTVLGRTMLLDGTPHRIVGVLPAGLPYPEQTPIWTPLHFGSDELRDGMRGARYLDVIARIRPEADLGAASAELDAFVAGLGATHPNHEGWGATAAILRLDLIAPYRGAVTLLLGAALLFLLITAANVAGLAAARQAEAAHAWSVREALGATTTRLTRQTAIEGLLLAGVGAGLATVLAMWSLPPLHRLAPADIPRLEAVALGWRILIPLFGVAAAIGVVTAVGGRLLARVGGVSTVARGPDAHRRRHRGRSALLVTQIALATVLLVGGGLLLDHFRGLARADLGFEPDGVSAALVVLPEDRYATSEQRLQFFDAVRARLSARDLTVAVGTNPPVAGSTMRFGYRVDGVDGTQHWAQYHSVSPGYFRVLGIPLVDGRTFTESDASGPPVVIVSEALAREHFPDGTAVGREISVVMQPRTIVGVVESTQHFGPDREAPAEVYVPLAQNPWLLGHVLVSSPTPLPHGALADVVAGIDPSVAAPALTPFRDYLVTWFAPLRFQLIVVGALALVGTVLGAIGLFGLISYLVSRRTREIGIRLALGARHGAVARGVVGYGMMLAATGLMLGSGVALLLQRVLRSLVPGVDASQPVAFVLVAAIVMGVTVAACALPARRAALVEPARALRHD